MLAVKFSDFVEYKIAYVVWARESCHLYPTDLGTGGLDRYGAESEERMEEAVYFSFNVLYTTQEQA